MNWKFWEEEESELDAPINMVLLEMSRYKPFDPEWTVLMKQLKQLKKLEAAEKKSWFHRIDTNTVVTGVCNIGIVVAIAMYENKHVLTSKGAAFIKPVKS